MHSRCCHGNINKLMGKQHDCLHDLLMNTVGQQQEPFYFIADVRTV